MQLSALNETNEQDIIDGQQRISTFLILLKVLKLNFPTITELKTLDFNWLETEVNSGKQQEKLQELINIDSQDLIKNDDLNKYVSNAHIISQVLFEQIKQENEDDIAFDPLKFIAHLYSNVYFVVIETNASLSKTLQIFDAINTTGLDLNAGDILYSGKVKNILCRLSALLEEDYSTQLPDKIKNVIDKIFHSPIDIEHIQSYNDEIIAERDKINLNGEKILIQ